MGAMGIMLLSHSDIRAHPLPLLDVRRLLLLGEIERARHARQRAPMPQHARSVSRRAQRAGCSCHCRYRWVPDFSRTDLRRAGGRATRRRRRGSSVLRARERRGRGVLTGEERLLPFADAGVDPPVQLRVRVEVGAVVDRAHRQIGRGRGDDGFFAS